MKNLNTWDITRYEKGNTCSMQRSLVQEYPLKLVINDRELATLVASPHQLNFLIAGFLRLQGFIESLDDIQTLGVCSEFGVANVRIKGTVPDRLKPTLTSGCGSGINFAVPDLSIVKSQINSPAIQHRWSPDELFSLMKDLNRRSGLYRDHGGIHSAGIGDGNELLLVSEDIGRHNTFDRIAGEAMFKGIDLQDKILLTSGRVSTEMAAKAVMLGIAVIASRSTPTDMAVKMCRKAGITLVGYLRGGSFEIFSAKERISCLREINVA
jgi:FdhD protein